jgi:hypothetical protein
MIDQLPNEILLVNILNGLPFRDKLQCALTCRKWYSIISNTILYSEISFKYPQSNARIMTKLKSKAIGLQILDLRVFEMNDALGLCELCPNLKSLQMGNWICEDWNDENNALLAHNWRKLQVIDETHYHGIGKWPPSYLLTAKLLDAPSQMMSLVRLSVDLFALKEYQIQTFFEQLKHAPALEFLNLMQACSITYDNLDLLHRCTPNLKRLELWHPFYVREDLEERHAISMDLSVCSNLRSFHVFLDYDGNPELDGYLQSIAFYWVEYVCHKYTSLIDVTVHIETLDA